MIALNIEMPKTCRECPCQDRNEEYSPFCYAADCMSKILRIDRNKKPDECPLVDLEENENDV